MKNLLKLLAKTSLSITGIILLLLANIAPVYGQQPLEFYQARLSESDHYNTEGVRLWTIAGIIRQDRANFHTYGILDCEDEWETLYDNANNRQNLERILSRQTFSNYEYQRIVYGEPLIQVIIYPNYIDVIILQGANDFMCN